MLGDYQNAINYLQRTVQVAQEGGAIWCVAEAHCYLGTAFLEISPTLIDSVKEHHDRALETLNYPAGNLMGATAWGELGYCALQLGDLEQARQFFEDGLTKPTIPQMMERPRLLAHLAKLALMEGEWAECDRLLSEAWEKINEYELIIHKPYVALVRGQAAQARGDHQIALASLDQSESLALEIGMLPTARVALLAAADSLKALGKREEAEVKRQSARELRMRVAELFTDKSLRSYFLGEFVEDEGMLGHSQAEV
jgi:tetratricopeptide (TPR) repeat protein